MEPATGVFLLAITALLLYTATRLCQAIIWNYHRSGEIRRQLAYRLKTLPMSRVLESNAIPIQFYLHYQPLVEIERQLRNCESCPSKQACLTAANDTDHQDFCSNNQDFTAVQAALRH